MAYNQNVDDVDEFAAYFLEDARRRGISGREALIDNYFGNAEKAEKEMKALERKGMMTEKGPSVNNLGHYLELALQHSGRES